MFDATNLLRSKYSLPLIDIKDIFKIEQQAMGHVDYVEKFALYCLELGRGERK
jgi:hypothetical protein